MRTVSVLLTTVVALVAAALTLAVPAAAATGTSYTWIGDGDSNAWTDSANWSPTGVPGTGDTVLIEAPSDDACHAHVTGVPSGLSLADLTLDEHLFHGNPDSPCLTSLDDGSITVTHAFVFHAGTLDTPVTIAAGATGTITPGAAHDTTAIGTGGVVVDGALALTDNRLAGDAGADQHLSLSGGPGITVDAGATLTAAGTNDLRANCCLDPAHLLNRGTVQLSGTTTLDAVELDQDGTLNATNGGRIVTDFAPQTAGNGARWTGTGSWLMSSTSDITATGTQTLGSGFTWILGGSGSTSDERLLGTFSMAGTGRFEWDGGTVGAALTIGKTITAVVAGTPTADPRFLDGLDGSSPVAVTNHGSLTFAADGGFHGTDSGRIVNASDGTLTLTPGLSVDADCCSTATSAIVTSGKVVVPAPTGGATTVALSNISYRATGGSTNVAPAAVLALSGGATGSLASTTITGGGSLTTAAPLTASGSSTVDTATTFVVATHGSLTGPASGSATVGGAGRLRWTGGTLSGPLTLAPTGGVTVSGTAAKNVTATASGAATSITFAGPTSLTAGTAKTPNTVTSDGGTRLRFTGTLTLAGNTGFAGGALTTSGTTNVAAGTGSAAVTGNATLVNTGALTVRTGTLASDNTVTQTAGTTTVAAGATLQLVGSSAALKINGGTLAGAGTVTGNVAVTSGVLAPGTGTGGTGTFTVTGTLTTASTSTVQLDLGSSARDQISVGGRATLRGTLRLADLAGYQPATGDVVTVVTAGPLSAVFSCTTTTGTGAGTQHWVPKVVTTSQLQLVSQAGAPASC